MIHEILFTLLGHTGSIIIELPATLDDLGTNPDLRQVLFIVNPNLVFLSAAEIEQLNKIVQIGALYKQIQNFVNKYGGINSKLALQLAYKEGPKDGNESAEMAQNVGSDMGSALDDQQDEDDQALMGVYIKAFCSGVSEILTVYKEHLLAIEHEYLKDRSLTIASL